jgi:hypothetical protein
VSAVNGQVPGVLDGDPETLSCPEDLIRKISREAMPVEITETLWTLMTADATHHTQLCSAASRLYAPL